MSAIVCPSELSRFQMVRNQLVRRGICSRSVLSAMGRVRRDLFVPEPERQVAYDDRALPIECGQTISQPYMVALMTEALELGGHERVLEVGTGSGYQTAVLAELAGHVVSIERHAELSALAGRRLAELGYDNVKLVVGDGTLGWPEDAPYDRILVTAGAPPNLPESLVDQLADDGLLVIPAGSSDSQTLKVVHKFGTAPSVTELTACRFVPLVGAEGWSESA